MTDPCRKVWSYGCVWTLRKTKFSGVSRAVTWQNQKNSPSLVARGVISLILSLISFSFAIQANSHRKEKKSKQGRRIGQHQQRMKVRSRHSSECTVNRAYYDRTLKRKFARSDHPMHKEATIGMAVSQLHRNVLRDPWMTRQILYSTCPASERKKEKSLFEETFDHRTRW